MHRIAIALAVSSCLFVSGSALAQSCSTLAGSQLSWVNGHPGNYVGVTVTSLKPGTATTNAVSTFATGYMDAYWAGFGFYWNGVWIAGRASIYSNGGGGREQSSARSNLVTLNPTTPARWQHFSAFQANQVDFTLYGNGQFDISFVTTGGVTSITSPTCTNNVLSGFGSDGVFYAVAFQQLYLG